MSPEFHWSVEAASYRPSDARHRFVDWLHCLDVTGMPTDDWALVFSELLTNACSASPGPEAVIVHANLIDGRIILRVTNMTTGSVPAVQPRREADDGTGRGLRIA